jgi:U3 small nucleolar RNA-associated protein 19
MSDHKSLLSEKPSAELRTAEFVQNVLDLLRVIPTPVKGQAIDSSLCLINGDHENEDDESEDGSQSDSSEDEDHDTKKLTKKRSLKAEGVTSSSTKKRRRDFNLSEQIQDVHCHIKLFSKCWVLFFSLPLTTKQIKLSLKHLPEYVIPILYQPLLLADYLSNLVSNGGVIGVLALESLFHLIIEYNLDYPNFFNCLYSLLSVEVLSAKYRTKYMNLLHLSLKSANVPEYSVAGFIKKLSVLTLMIPGPAVMFCLTQVSNEETHPFTQ